MVEKDCKCKNCDCKDRESFYVTLEDGKPFIDQSKDDLIIRTFSKEIPSHLLKWHIDEENRIIWPIEENDWQFQFDNKLPIPIDGKIEISKGIEHRIIKGTTDLIIAIKK
jgi:hypothetical protein